MKLPKDFGRIKMEEEMLRQDAKRRMKQFKAEWQTEITPFLIKPRDVMTTIDHLITQINVLVEDESGYRQNMNEWINGLEERVRVLEEQGVLSEREEEKKLHQPPVTSWGKEPKKWEHPGKPKITTIPKPEWWETVDSSEEEHSAYLEALEACGKAAGVEFEIKD